MTIGSITPTASLLAALGSAGDTPSVPTTAGASPSLFTSLLKDELEVVASELATADGATATGGEAAATAATAASPPAGVTPTSTAAGTTGASAGIASGTVTGLPGGTSGGHMYVVSYEHGATPASTGPTPAPLVRGTTGKLRITAKTTGLTQLTVRLTGTVADPTAAAKATAATMAAIAHLQAEGQA